MSDLKSIEVLVDEELEKRLLLGVKTILYVGIRYDYGHPEWGLSYEHYNFYQTFLNMGYSLIYFDYDRLYCKYGNEKISKILLEAVYYYQPDILFYFNFHDWIKHEVWKEISNKTATKTIIWSTDDYRRYDETKSIWELFNLIITTDKESYNKRKIKGYDVKLSQWACGYYFTSEWSRQNLSLNIPKIYDVNFVGRCYGEREEFIETLRKHKIKIATFGPGWKGENNRKFSQMEFINIFRQSKIVLNTSHSIDGLYTIKGRDFEAPGCGSLLLTKNSDEIREYFIPGKEIVTYKDVDDAAEKIKFYLKNDIEREKIAENGYKRVLKDHTYEKRFEEFLK